MTNPPSLPHTTPLQPGATSPVLTAEHLSQLAAARQAARKIKRAVSVANFDGWSIGIMGGLTLMFSISSLSGILIGAALAGIAFIELCAAKKLRAMEPGSTKMLGFNQLALASLIILYALSRIYAESTGHGMLSDVSQGNPEVESMLKDVSGEARSLITAFYMLLIAFAVLAQGGLALYYFSRAKFVRAYLEQTPEWIIAMQKSGVPL